LGYPGYTRAGDFKRETRSIGENFKHLLFRTERIHRGARTDRRYLQIAYGTGDKSTERISQKSTVLLLSPASINSSLSTAEREPLRLAEGAQSRVFTPFSRRTRPLSISLGILDQTRRKIEELKAKYARQRGRRTGKEPRERESRRGSRRWNVTKNRCQTLFNVNERQL